MGSASTNARGVNLLRLRPIRAIYRWSLFPYVVQAVILVGFVGLAVFGWGLVAPDGIQSKQFAKTNIVNLLIWGLWWPVMVWIAVLFGRIWCAVCPLELVANVTERLGRLIGLRQRSLSGWLRSGMMILVLYVAIQMLVAGAQLHRVPAYTSVFLWSLIGLAAIAGLLYRDRAFCRAFCPVGLLLSAYGRGGMLAARATKTNVCDACPGHDCREPKNRTRPDGRSCPSLLNPATLGDNADCLLCGQCTKVCPYDNVGLHLRSPFPAADTREQTASRVTTLFLIVVSGFVTYELFSEWKAAKAVYLWVPHAASEAIGLAADNGWIKGVWMLLMAPLALWVVLGGLVVLLRGARGLNEAWRRLALPLAVVISAGHMAKGLAKVASWGGYLPMAVKEPVGTETALAITAGTMAKPGSLMSMIPVCVVSLVLLVAMGTLSLRESYLADPLTHRSRMPSILLAILGSGSLIFGWGFLQ